MGGLISIIVPIYNSEAFLEKCVRSILCQTYSNIEVILVNDGSTDGSAAICERLAGNDNRIRVIHKENGGTPGARNAGLDIAKGEYVGFVDSDDTIEPDMYEQLHNHLVLENVDMVDCSYKTFYKDYTGIINIKPGKFSPVQICEMFITDYRLLNCLFSVSVTKLIRTSLLQKGESLAKLTGLEGVHDGITDKGVRFPLWPRQIENEVIVESDLAFIASCVVLAEKGMAFINIAPYNYRADSSQATQVTAIGGKNIQLHISHIEKCMTALLPSRTKEIHKAAMLCGYSFAIGAYHGTAMRNIKPKNPLSFKTLCNIMLYAPITNIPVRACALCLYLFPASVYRFIFQITSPIHGVKMLPNTE